MIVFVPWGDDQGRNYCLRKASETWEHESKVVGLKLNASEQQMCKIPKNREIDTFLDF